MPDFRALEKHYSGSGQGKAKHWRFFAEHPLGKTWYELLIESSCVAAFALDVVIQVRAWTTVTMPPPPPSLLSST